MDPPSEASVGALVQFLASRTNAKGRMNRAIRVRTWPQAWSHLLCFSILCKTVANMIYVSASVLQANVSQAIPGEVCICTVSSHSMIAIENGAMNKPEASNVYRDFPNR